MRKKYLSALLFGVALTTATGTFVSCKDYDDDIDNLQEQIDKNAEQIEANRKQIDQINTLISSGSVITGVEKNSEGVKITLSNGTSYTLTNGADGNDAVVWTIGDDGYWYQDGTKTNYKAIGEDGAKGDAGEKGDTGAKGDDGDEGPAGPAGNYYKPNPTTGCFDLCDADGNVLKQTNISYKADAPSAITAVMDNDNLILSNVAGSEENIVISLSNSLRGLVFEGDHLDGGKVARTYVDGVPAIAIQSFSYNALTLSNKEKQTEKATAAATATVINPKTYAYYHVNPANASEKDLQNLTFVVKADADYISTRAAASTDFAATASFVEFKDGILKVEVNVNGTPATDEKISVVALQTQKENDENITSDYATIYKNDMKELRIADGKKFAAATSLDYHFRRYIDAVDSEAGNANKAWSVYTDKANDLELEYEGSLDLNEIVNVHQLTTPHSVADLEALGLNLKYEVVQEYIIGANQTNQKDFVTLTNGVLTSRVFDTTGAAAIGRTPIIRVSLMHGNKIVEVAYIKVKIVKPGTVPPADPNYDLVVNNFKFVCATDGASTTTVEQINKQLYNEIGMSKAEFHALYDQFDDTEATTGLGTVTEITETIEGETTHLLKWDIKNDDLWDNAGKEVSHKVTYSSTTTGGKVTVTLKATIEGIQKTYNVVQADFINEYWDAAKTYARFNVAVPQSTTDANPANCVFVNDLNSPFTTKAGILKLDDAVTNITYTFCEDMEGAATVGGIQVTYGISADGLKLYAIEGTTAPAAWNDSCLIATIDNSGTEVPFNTVTLNKNSDLAKKLLNTTEFSALYAATGIVCDDDTKTVNITFNGEDHFEAFFIRPVNIAQEAADNFIDGVDFGEEGSYIRLEDLINPYDWRNRYFSDYTNYWGFYGSFNITADIAHAECNLNGKRGEVPATIQLGTAGAGTLGSLTSQYGFITYKNNGTTSNEAFDIFVKVNVEYGWGTIQTDWITVKVEPTIVGGGN